MKSKALILLASVLLLNSCIVKSLQPFYTKGDISYIESLIGEWTDQKKGAWTVTSVKAEFAKNQKENIAFSEESKKTYKAYKDGYIIKYIKNEKEAMFLAMPFKIQESYFLDFIPFDFDTEGINNLAASHLVKAHSVAKLEYDNTNTISFLWLTEEHIKNLFKENTLRLKHELIGIEEELLLTASSQELSAFLKKYNTSSIKDKWKSSDTMTLTKSTR